MHISNSFEKVVPKITDKNFKSCALELFYHQATHNSVYGEYIRCLGKDASQITEISEIPFLPIEFFKDLQIRTGDWKEQTVFLSSGTTGQKRSRHLVKQLSAYQSLTQITFERLYGSLDNLILLALLPSYQKQGNSSLIAMVDHFIQSTHDPHSGYVTMDQLKSRLTDILHSEKRLMLIGVSYALLDCLPMVDLPTDRLVVLETGGMKGRRREMIRMELHDELTRRFNTSVIHSEYGMTELFSQAYSKRNGQFVTPPWMKVLIRDMNDPFVYLGEGHTGGVNVIDLANYDSCAFVETKDIGRVTGNSFEVLGRFDNSDIRGCNLLMA